jgi:chaperonin GroES|tara:strand:- start:4487 stop:4795 length:309 start_codon:yes stop_codon:yes gene_type:complete
MAKKLLPLNDRVIIQAVEEDEQMYGNIVIPDMGKEKPEIGKVVAVGPGRHSEFGTFITVNAKVGDLVLIPKIGSLRMDFEGQEYLITPDKEILAVIKEEDNE